MNTKQIILRPGKPDDAAACGSICYEAFKTTAGHHQFPPDFPNPEIAIGLFTHLLSRSDLYSVVAEADGKLVGSNFLWENGVIAGVGPITIDPAAQNIAVGKRLMEDVMRRAQERQFAGVRLVQAAYHNRSLSLYTKLGFDAREPLSNIQGPALQLEIPARAVRLAKEKDLPACNELCRRVHGHDRSSELLDAVRQGTANVVEHAGRITGYGTLIGFFGHAVGESNEDLKALIGAAREFPGPGFLLPTRNSDLLRWCLKMGLRIVQPMTLMSVGLYNEPKRISAVDPVLTAGGCVMDVKELQSRVEGSVTVATDPGYEDLRRGLVWNQLTPARYPKIVIQVASEQDVVEAIGFARRHDLKVAVRGGGHSWVGFPLRDGSLLIDLGRLKRAQINPDARRATIQPAINGRDLNWQLAAHGLAFPVGHCPSVPLSGFLLNGGLGWNSNAWGPACFSVEAARVVTADGAVLVADAYQNAELLWAIRGGGPGFFAVVTEYELKLYPAPRAIMTSSYYYPLQEIEALGSWAASVASKLRKEVELSIFVVAAPPAIAERSASSNGFVAVLSAIAFLDATLEAEETLGLLEGGPLAGECLHKEINQPSSIETLHEMGAMLWPERHRYRADTLWADSPPAPWLGSVRDYFLRAPSPKSLAVCVLATGPENSGPALPDAAFSMATRTAFLGYAIWERPEDDEPNSVWHHAMMSALDAFAAGHYVGESDIVVQPVRAERSFAAANWRRLEWLRRKYDPEGVFHGQFNGASR